MGWFKCKNCGKEASTIPDNNTIEGFFVSWPDFEDLTTKIRINRVSSREAFDIFFHSGKIHSAVRCPECGYIVGDKQETS